MHISYTTYMYIIISIATSWNLECDFGNGALQKSHRKMPKSGVLHFFAPFFQSRHLSNGDLRMRAHRIVYHIIVLLSWFWVGIVRSPRSSNVDLECRHLSCDFHQQRMLFFKFYRHFGHILHFFGVLVLSQVSSIYWNMTTSKFDQKILLPSWFWHVLIGYFQGDAF